jgi:predicted NAD/FAD-binding protein
MKRIAIVGAGISGLAAAYVLSRRHRVWLFEREPRLGGHTHTVTVGDVPLDTGFLVHNDRTYPNLVRLFREIGIESQSSDMCFAVSCRRTGLEYSSRGARGFFAQKRNLLRPSHLRLLTDILRFNREAPVLLSRTDAAKATLGDFLESHRFGEQFRRLYLYPMASAIWSSSLDSVNAFPALTLIRFLDNHGLLSVSGQPKWKTVVGGSHRYIPKLTAGLGDRVVTGAHLQGIRRTATEVTLTFFDRPAMTFDDVVIATHGDEVLPLLADPTERERDVFGAFQTTANTTWLHTDDQMLPRRSGARASWNYVLPDEGTRPPTVTYHLNRLQRIAGATEYCVTLNPRGSIDERRVLRKMVYSHPLYTRDAIRAQARWDEVSGVQRTHYAGAYWFYGFHEDGLNSALRVAQTLGVDW